MGRSGTRGSRCSQSSPMWCKSSPAASPQLRRCLSGEANDPRPLPERRVATCGVHVRLSDPMTQYYAICTDWITHESLSCCHAKLRRMQHTAVYAACVGLVCCGAALCTLEFLCGSKLRCLCSVA